MNTVLECYCCYSRLYVFCLSANW